MPHVDEGELHAYVDGGFGGGDPRVRQIEAHVAQCAGCRARVDEARALRDRVRAVLRAGDAVSTVAPPFDDVLRRASRRSAQRARRWVVPVTWAASLVMAVTAGWYGRTLLTPRTAPSQIVASSPIDAVPPARERDQAKLATPAAAAGPRQLADAGVAAGGSRPTLVSPPAQPAAPETAAGRAPDMEKTEELKDARDRVTVADAPANFQRAADAAPPTAALGAAEERARRSVRDENAWLTVSRDEAARRVGGPVGEIPGLPSLGYAVSGRGDAAVVRTIQVLGPGMTIELYQRSRPARPEASAAPQPSAAGGRAEARAATVAGPGSSVTVDWEGFAVTAQAYVPADSLRRLLARLRAAP